MGKLIAACLPQRRFWLCHMLLETDGKGAEMTFLLSTIAHGRSGDKGDHANVAIIAYTPAGYAWIRQHLTAARVRDYFAPLKPSNAERFEAPNLHAVNFLLHN